MVLRKDQIEASLHEEKKLIGEGKLKEENPLDVSETFIRLCEACRRGDLKSCQETITEGANINARVRTFRGRSFMLDKYWVTYHLSPKISESFLAVLYQILGRKT